MDTFIIEFCYKNVTVKEDGNNFTANCRICPNKTISGSIRSSSNFLKHVKVRHPLRFKEYEKLKDMTWKKKKRVLTDFDETGSSAEAEPSPSGGRERFLLREIKKEDDVQAIFLGSDFGAEARASPLGVEILEVGQNNQGSPMGAEGHPPDDSLYEDRRRRPIFLPTPTCQEVPWSGFETAFTFVRQKGKNVVVQCNYCLPAIKHVSSAITSASNVKKHLERAHPEKLREIERVRKARRRSRYEPPADAEEPSPAKMPKPQEPITHERWGSGREPVTQRILDRKIMDFIVEETLPLQTVEKASFVGLVRLGLPKDLTVMGAKTLRERIEKRAASMQETLAHRMGAVEYVATTADCWLDGKKCFFEVTAHWICPTTLKREFGALACRRLRGRPTAERLAQALHHVHVQYRIHNKVVGTTTDSGANFRQSLLPLPSQRAGRTRRPRPRRGGRRRGRPGGRRGGICAHFRAPGRGAESRRGRGRRSRLRRGTGRPAASPAVRQPHAQPGGDRRRPGHGFGFLRQRPSGSFPEALLFPDGEMPQAVVQAEPVAADRGVHPRTVRHLLERPRPSPVGVHLQSPQAAERAPVQRAAQGGRPHGPVFLGPDLAGRELGGPGIHGDHGAPGPVPRHLAERERHVHGLPLAHFVQPGPEAPRPREQTRPVYLRPPPAEGPAPSPEETLRPHLGGEEAPPGRLPTPSLQGGLARIGPKHTDQQVCHLGKRRGVSTEENSPYQSFHFSPWPLPAFPLERSPVAHIFALLKC
ncbi:hypothetical protein JRQ81_012112, partial [Phrynocephalus forsythii]